MIEKVIKYGQEVWQDTEMDSLRKTRCLCFNCEDVKTCYKAKTLYEMCKKEDMAMMITRCKTCKPKSI